MPGSAAPVTAISEASPRMSLDRFEVEGNTLLPERIASTLRNAIVGSVLAPGARLEEQALSKRLGVSRVPLREAFRVLAGEGLVVIQPNRGAVVSERSEGELRELFAVRSMFEFEAARLLARSRPLAVLDALEAMIGDMKRAVRARRYDDYARIAAQFHDLMVAQCGNHLIGQLYDRIRTNLRRYQLMMVDLPGSPAKSIREHETILAAIRTGKAAAAARAAAMHVGELVQRFEQNHKPAASSIAKGIPAASATASPTASGAAGRRARITALPRRAATKKSTPTMKG